MRHNRPFFIFIFLFFGVFCAHAADENMFTVSGVVKRFNGTPVKNAVVTLTATTTLQTTTDANGAYQFDNVPAGTNAVLTVAKTTDLFDCFTVRDVASSFEHILGISSLDPNLVNLSDINKSGSLTTFDVVLQQSLLLNIPIPDPYTFDWFIFKEGGIFTNPDDFTVELNNIQSDQIVNWNAVKMGDATDCVGDEHGPSIMTISIPSLYVLPNTSIEVPITCSAINGTKGYQFGLSWDPNILTLEEVILVDEPGLKAFPDQNTLRMKFMDVINANQYQEGTVLLKLKFKTSATATGNAELKVDPAVLYPEVIDNLLKPYDIAFNIGGINVSDTKQLDAFSVGLSVAPNPTADALNLVFETAPAAAFTVHVFDLQGRLVRQENRTGGQLQYNFSVENLAKGSYLVEILEDGQRIGRTRFQKM